MENIFLIIILLIFFFILLAFFAFSSQESVAHLSVVLHSVLYLMEKNTEY